VQHEDWQGREKNGALLLQLINLAAEISADSMVGGKSGQVQPQNDHILEYLCG
jgi:hypothetical protein